MYRVLDIAQWFINKAASEVGEGGEYLTNLKLQKLLYYAQGCYGAMCGEKLFNEKIYNWAHGPVVKEVYSKYKKYHDNVINDTKRVMIDNKTEAILLEVHKVFGKYSAWALRNMTHEETPWKKTVKDQEIPFNLIKEYFEENIIAD